MTIRKLHEVVGEWSGQGVDAEAVQGNLTKLWRAGAQHNSRKGLPPASRTNILTLVVFAASPADMETAAAAVDHVRSFQPSRTIFVLAEPGSTSTLDADVSTRCLVDRPNICFEDIRLVAHGNMDQQLVSAVNSLLVHDLPTVVWCASDLCDKSLVISELCLAGNRLVVDTAQSSDFYAAVAALAGLRRQNSQLHVSDLQWNRLTPWRSALASLFDDPKLRVYLNDVTALRFGTTQPADPVNPSSLLFTAWLASCLGWRANYRPDGSRMTALARDRSIAIELGDGANRELVSIGLTATGKDGAASFTARVRADGSLSTSVSLPSTQEQTHASRGPVTSLALLLEQELGWSRRDASYETSLAWIAALSGTAGGVAQQ